MFGLFHGLVYLPVILSLIGPKPYASALAKYKPKPSDQERAAAEPLKQDCRLSIQDFEDSPKEWSATPSELTSASKEGGRELMPIINGKNERSHGESN